jgi:hypothetical protein
MCHRLNSGARGEQRLGPVEVFVANAGVPGGAGLGAPDDVWSKCWRNAADGPGHARGCVAGMRKARRSVLGSLNG